MPIHPECQIQWSVCLRCHQTQENHVDGKCVLDFMTFLAPTPKQLEVAWEEFAEDPEMWMKFNTTTRIWTDGYREVSDGGVEYNTINVHFVSRKGSRVKTFLFGVFDADT